MQRCPSCQSRLKDANPQCPRCGADFSQTLQCGTLAKLWLSLAMQMLNAGEEHIAVAALLRSLSFKQTLVAQFFRGFLTQLQFKKLYENIAQQRYEEAHQTLLLLQTLEGDRKSLHYFNELIEYLLTEHM